MVMREILGSSVTPTAKLSMLKPRRENSPATFERTTGWCSTRTASVYFIPVPSLYGRRVRVYPAHQHKGPLVLQHFLGNLHGLPVAFRPFGGEAVSTAQRYKIGITIQGSGGITVAVQ